MNTPMHPLGLRDIPSRGSGDLLPRKVVVPTDLLVGAWRDLLPPERMFFLGGRPLDDGVMLSSARDVTGPMRSSVYVSGDPDLLARCLIDFENTGAHIAAWFHSHPGLGAGATYPSGIDLRQDEDLRRHFGDDLFGMIATSDGYIRFWGETIDAGRVVLQFRGIGIEAVEGEGNVFRLAV